MKIWGNRQRKITKILGLYTSIIECEMQFVRILKVTLEKKLPVASSNDLELGQERLKKAVKEAVCFHDPVCTSSTHLFVSEALHPQGPVELLGALLKRILGLT